MARKKKQAEAVAEQLIARSPEADVRSEFIKTDRPIIGRRGNQVNDFMAEFARAKKRHEKSQNKPVITPLRSVTRAEDLAARRST